MRALYAFFLSVFHFIYSVVLAVHSFWKRHSDAAPQPLRATRQRIPRHLAIVFAVDPKVPNARAKEILVESIVDAVSWCRAIGVKKLTVYEENDLLSTCLEGIRERTPTYIHDTESSDSDTEYPITPPPSDYSESRPLSPVPSIENVIPVTMLTISTHESEEGSSADKNIHRRRRNSSKNTPKDDLLLCLASKKSSTPAIAKTATMLARVRRNQPRQSIRSLKNESHSLSVTEFDQILEDKEGLSSPDFMIIHPVESFSSPPAPPELHGFPPWHIRLTEIFLNRPYRPTLRKWFGLYSTPPPLPLDEISFRAALDEFSSAEMRFGK